MSDVGALYRLKFKCGGEAFEMELASSTLIERVKELVAERLKRGPSHVKLINRGKVLTCGTLESTGLRDRTMLMVMPTADYHRDAASLEVLDRIRTEADAVTETGPAAHERLTQLLCKLDAVDVSHSDWLRQRRKATISYIEAKEKA